MQLSTAETYSFYNGASPILISMPHSGTALPAAMYEKMTADALKLPDVDWHLPRLYDKVMAFEPSIISAEYARYVIDLNRSPEDICLYPGQDTTGLCPTDTFAKQAVYIKGCEPSKAEIKQRIEQYWRPYHDKLNAELKRIHAIYGIAILWDAHSIASHVPRFFSGQLPDLNFGTVDASSCNPALQNELAATMQRSIHAIDYSYVFNGRFKGGYITRHYAAPNMNIHAIQLEMSQSTYMKKTASFEYDAALATKIKPLLTELLNTCLDWAYSH